MEEGRGKPPTYARLVVFQRSYAAALRLHRLTRGWRTTDPDLVHQLRRASRSIPANIAEGVNISNTAAETKRFLGLALRSCDEVRVWLCFCRDLDLLPAVAAAQWEQEYAEIGAMLYRLWQRWQHTAPEAPAAPEAPEAPEAPAAPEAPEAPEAEEGPAA